ncbi:MAG: hypothetical protein QOK05_180 [Chloroflexota bacterium]|jgi:signal transduction histidine kinase|nr:hypothetical protein [Chloroflexota bacterium]
MFALLGIAASLLVLAVAVAGFTALSLTMPASIPRADAEQANILLDVPFIAMGGIGALILIRQPGNRVGWLVLVCGVLLAVGQPGPEYVYRVIYAHDLPREWAAPILVSSGLAYGVASLELVILPLVFPDGRLPSARWRILVIASVVSSVIGFLISVLDPTALGDGNRYLVNPFGVPAIHPLASTINAADTVFTYVGAALALGSGIYRYRRSDGDVRHQLKWFYGGLATLVVGLILAGVVSPPSPQSNWSTLGTIIGALAFSALPFTIGIAVLKYRLYDIDVVISRALVYGTLAVFITVIYVGIVVGIGSLVGQGDRPNLVLSIVATAVVAVGFQPVRERVTRLANRLVYGRRATPYEVLSEFSQRVAESYAAEEVLARMAQVLAEGTGAEHAAVWLRGGNTLRRVAAFPTGDGVAGPVMVTGQILPALPDGDRAVPVRHQGELLGALTITKRRSESLSPVEQKLLDDLAHQAGLVMKNVGLTADLQARLHDLRESRKRLVTAQDAERRRLERNLHDGAQQHLVALKVKLGLAEMLASKDPVRTETTLDELASEADEALATLRDLARGIYPPLLAERGLAAALESQARKATLPVQVVASGLARYTDDVEAAVYFCTLEALQNVQKYAGASAATVTLADAGGRLRFQVADNGVGFAPETAQRGAGLQNIADRIDALDGRLSIDSTPGTGTTISAEIPVPV